MRWFTRLTRRFRRPRSADVLDDVLARLSAEVANGNVAVADVPDVFAAMTNLGQERKPNAR